MNRKSRAADKFLQGTACSQAILSEYATLFGLSTEVAMKIAAGFAGGMGRANVCGGWGNPNQKFPVRSSAPSGQKPLD